MLIYNGTKKSFCDDVNKGNIADVINNSFSIHGIKHDNEREYLSWKNSLVYMANIINCDLFADNIQIAIEYQIPQTSKRVDFIIAGENELGKQNVVIIELKQWTKAKRTQRHYVVKAYTGGKERDVVHPSYQAYSYAKTIENYNTVVSDKEICIFPCAYLHNYEDQYIDEIVCDHYADVLRSSPAYFKKDEKDLRDFIKRYVTRPSATNIMYEIDNGKIKPTKAVQDALGSMLNGNEEFFLIDEQRVVYETVYRLVHRALEQGKKYTVIIEGGAGTGKSVVAIQLLASMIKAGYNAQYVTKNAAPRNVYYELLSKGDFRKAYIYNLFKSSGGYINSKPNEIDLIVVDESHRLVEKSGYYGNNGENQIKEIINAAKVSVFFIDESQIVTAKDIGRISEIKKWANYCNSFVFHNESTKLVSQFRCNGSDGYILLLDSLLQINTNGNSKLIDMDYDFRVFDDLCEMREALRIKNYNNKARLVAGYCYQWLTRNNPLSNTYDINIGDFHAKWNYNNTKTWAIDPNSFDQVGCIHTSQGLEFDYVGVIVGKDLFCNNGQVLTNVKAHPRSDISFLDVNNNICDLGLADKIIRNTYKTLMTRGQKGCYVYCEDICLRDYFKEVLSQLVSDENRS